MTRSKWPVLLAAIAAIALTGAAPPHQFPRCVHSPFEGITRTNPIGTVIGDPDARDWGCVGHGNSGAGTSRRLSPAGTTPSDVPVPPPTTICMQPASPNPAESATTLHFVLPASEHVTLTIYGRGQGHGGHEAVVVRSLADGDLAAGAFTVAWDLRDDHGARVPSGTYRAVLVVGDEALCGDIEVP